MTPDRWRQVEALYNVAVAHAGIVPSDADPDLRREVESLLAQNSGIEVPGQSLLHPGTIETVHLAHQSKNFFSGF